MIALVSCVKGKQARPALAKDLYTSPLFRKARALVERYGFRWAILSAEHGLVMPMQPLAPYDTTLVGAPIAEVRAWGERTRGQIQGTFPGETFLALAGSRYLTALDGLPYHDPMKGMRVGERLRWLTEALHDRNLLP